MLKNTFFLANIWLFQKKVVTLHDFCFIFAKCTRMLVV